MSSKKQGLFASHKCSWQGIGNCLALNLMQMEN